MLEQSYCNVSQLLILVLRVFPGLRQHAIVPVDVVWVEAQLLLLDVLLQCVCLLLIQSLFNTVNISVMHACFVKLY